MEQKKINQYVELLADNIVLMRNYVKFAGSSKRILVVEGSTDEKFVKKIINDDVWCVTALDAFSNEDCMMMSEEKLIKTNKEVIINVVYGLSVFPTLINSKGLGDWNVYGMVDMDFDSSEAHTDSSKLFITDTHDLETLLLSTDGELLGRLDKCTLPEEDIRRAYFVAYQIGFARSVIKPICKKELDLKPISAGKEDIDYKLFVKDDRLDIAALMKFINKGKMNGLSSAKLNQFIKKVLADKQLKKKVDDSGVWKQSLEEFCNASVNDFWNKMIGHDILALIRYFNPDAKRVYSNSRGHSLNREFEFDLIDKYIYENILSTNIYANMKCESVAKLKI